MAFALNTNNLTGVAVIDAPGGINATTENFTTLYDYANQNSPELVKELSYKNGKGKLTGFLNAVGQKKTYASDTVQLMEMNRLMNKLKNVALTGNVFTSPTPHNVRVGMILWISDAAGVTKQATVSAVASTTVFTALNNGTGAYGFTGNVSIIADFSNTFQPGTDPFATGRVWNPTPRINYTGIIKETYSASNSKMTQRTWLQMANGDVKWASEEIERTNTLFDNLYEYTHLFKNRLTDASAATAAGFGQGSKSITQQIEEYGNISNDYITTKANLDTLTYRIKLQSTGCVEYTMHCDHNQMVFLQTICAGLNSAFLNGSNYGAFDNDKDMSINLDFTSIFINGITIHFSLLSILDQADGLADANFANSGIAYYLIPSGKTDVMVSGESVSTPYLSLYHRQLGAENRERKVEIFGIGGTKIEADKTKVNFLTESTNLLAGANAFFVGRRGASFYA